MLRSISFESIVVSAKSPKTTMKPNWSHAQKIVGKHCFPTVPFQQFQVLFTLFSKYFSSFPHGTCSLSVSHQYLALDGIYHPLRAAIPNNSTRRKHTVRIESRHERGYHPPRRSVPGDLTQFRLLVLLLQTTTPKIFSLSFSRFSRPYWGNPC